MNQKKEKDETNGNRNTNGKKSDDAGLFEGYHTGFYLGNRSRSFCCLELYYRYAAEAGKRITHLVLQPTEEFLWWADFFCN